MRVTPARNPPTWAQKATPPEFCPAEEMLVAAPLRNCSRNHVVCARCHLVGLASGIVIDAFLVRMTLTPSVMALLGAKAWWMPKWLERVLPHFHLEGEAVGVVEGPDRGEVQPLVADDVLRNAADVF